MRLNHRVGLRGWFRVQLIDAKSGLIKRELNFPNLIVTAGFDAVGAGTHTISAMLGYMGVGTGTAAPTLADADLASPLEARTNSNGGIQPVPGVAAANEYHYYRKTFLFTEAQVNGNLTEVGVFRNASGTPMWTRQLFVDELNNPVVITKTSAEQLRIEYELRMYPPTVDDARTLNVNGVDYTVTTRATDIGTNSTWGANTSGATGLLLRLGVWDSNIAATAYLTNTMPAQTSYLSGSENAARSNIEAAAYIPGSNYRDITMIWDPSVANFTGAVVGAIGHGVGTDRLFATTFSPKIPKSNLQRLRFTTRFSWVQL